MAFGISIRNLFFRKTQHSREVIYSKLENETISQDKSNYVKDTKKEQKNTNINLLKITIFWKKIRKY